MLSLLKSPQTLFIPLTLLATLLPPSISRAQVVQDNLWITDGSVNTVVTSGDVIYVGGRFTGGPPGGIGSGLLRVRA